jgi:hypothetical protein
MTVKSGQRGLEGDPANRTLAGAEGLGVSLLELGGPTQGAVQSEHKPWLATTGGKPRV